MIADNYWFVRRVGARYAVTMEFMSDERPGPINHTAYWFDTLQAANDFAASEWTEYGTMHHASVVVWCTTTDAAYL